MNDQDLPEDGANPMAAALAAGAAANVTADEDGMAQDEGAVAVSEELLDDEFSDDDSDMQDEADDELDDEELAAIEMKHKMEEFFAMDQMEEDEFSELDVLTLEEAAIYLKIEFGDLRRMIKEQGLPGRKIGDEWRFLRGAIADWLRAPSGSATPAVQPEKPSRSERPARAERPAFDERPQREERPRRRFPDVEVTVSEGYPQQSQPPRPRPQFRSQNQFGGGAEAGGYQGGSGQGGAGQGSYPPPRRGRYESDQQQQQPPQGENRPPRKRPPFRAQEGGPTGGNQFGGSQGGAGQEGGRRFVGGPKKPKREALGNQRFKRLDRRRFGNDQGE